MEPSDVLARRARELARVPATHDDAPSAGMLVASIGPQRFGFAVADVIRVRALGRCVPIPFAPRGVIGVAKLEGNIRAVFGGRSWRGLPEQVTPETPVMLVGKLDAPLALLVDSVDDTRQIPISDLATPTSGESWLRAIVEDVLVVDVLRLIELLSAARGAR